MQFLVILTCWILGLIPISHSVKCYNCAWTTNEGGVKECKQEPPPSRFLTACSHPQCWKRLTIYEGNGSISSIQRYCLTVAVHHKGTRHCQVSDTLDNLTGKVIMSTRTCICDTDGCNGASGNLIGGVVVGAVRNKLTYHLNGSIMMVRSFSIMVIGWWLLLA